MPSELLENLIRKTRYRLEDGSKMDRVIFSQLQSERSRRESTSWEKMGLFASERKALSINDPLRRLSLNRIDSYINSLRQRAQENRYGDEHRNLAERLLFLRQEREDELLIERTAPKPEPRFLLARWLLKRAMLAASFMLLLMGLGWSVLKIVDSSKFEVGAYGRVGLSQPNMDGYMSGNAEMWLREGQRNTFKKEMLQSPERLYRPDKEGRTPLHWVAYFGALGMVKDFSQAAPQVLEQKDALGQSPLHWAVLYGHEALCSEFLKAGANPNLADESGWTPLHLAYALKEDQLVRLLKRAGAKEDLSDWKGRTPKALSLSSFSLKIWDLPEK